MPLSSQLTHLLIQEAHWRTQTINLNASENYTSPLVKRLIGLHPSGDNYSFPPAGGTIEGPWHFTQASFLQQIEDHISYLGKSLLKCASIDPRPKGGQAAEIATLTGLACTGDAVFYVQESDGGHFGLNFVSQKMGIQLIPLPFNPEKQQIDLDKTRKLMVTFWKKDTPRKLILIGQSFILRQQPLEKLVEISKASFPDCIIACDVSHTLGLIIGKQWINPITQGVDFIHGSTHKTFPGPQKGLLGFPQPFPKNLRTAIQQTLSPGLQSNCGTSEILALAATFEEMNLHGEAYARTVCEYARYLAQCLYQAGFSVVGKSFGFTESHQVWVIIGTEELAWQAFGKLHRAGIRSYPGYLPFVKTWGLRLSTQAITRLGFSKTEIRQVVHWISEVLINYQVPEKIFPQVTLLMQQFPLQSVKYALQDASLNTIFQGNTLEPVESPD